MSDVNTKDGCDELCGSCENIRFCDPVDIALNAAAGGVGPLPVIAVGDLTQAIAVVSVTIDAGSISDPSVLLKFTTQIGLPTLVEETLTATLNFIVQRTDIGNGTPVIIGPAFTYSTTATDLGTDSFAFQLFDDNIESGTYTYSVLLLPSIVVTLAGLTLVNSTLSALAVSDIG